MGDIRNISKQIKSFKNWADKDNRANRADSADWVDQADWAHQTDRAGWVEAFRLQMTNPLPPPLLV